MSNMSKTTRSIIKEFIVDVARELCSIENSIDMNKDMVDSVNDLWDILDSRANLFFDIDAYQMLEDVDNDGDTAFSLTELGKATASANVVLE